MSDDDFLTLEKLAAKMRPHFNEVCLLYDMEIVRLVGVADDERDFYYIVRGIAGRRDNREWWASAVGHCYSLKGLIPAERYEQTDRQLGYNGCGPADEFLVVVQKENETT